MCRGYILQAMLACNTEGQFPIKPSNWKILAKYFPDIVFLLFDITKNITIKSKRNIQEY